MSVLKGRETRKLDITIMVILTAVLGYPIVKKVIACTVINNRLMVSIGIVLVLLLIEMANCFQISNDTARKIFYFANVIGVLALIAVTLIGV